MSNDFGCDTCGYAREANDDEVLLGTHYCKLKKEYIEYIGWMCDDWIGPKRLLRATKMREYNKEVSDTVRKFAEKEGLI